MSKRSWSEVAPDTEEVWRQLSHELLDEIRQADEEVLAAQRSRISPEIAVKIEEATYSLRNRFRYWEEMVRGLENNWFPRDRYFVDEYVNNLDSRDGIDRVLAALPMEVGIALRPLLYKLDQRFLRYTTPDGGAELQPWVARLREGVQLTERWYRKPLLIPWC
mgnify:CR=1 FL=1